MFEPPHFTAWNVTYTAIGAAVYWGKWGRTKLKAYVLSDWLVLLPVDDKWRCAIELFTFVALGALIGVAIVQPLNAIQALTAGFSWTGVFAKHSK
jgi:hypothetical protein